MQNHSAIEEKYPDLDLFWIERLALYHGMGEDQQEYFIDEAGTVVYQPTESSPAEMCWTNFSSTIGDKWEAEFNTKSNYWIEFIMSGQALRSAVFSFREGRVVRLLENEKIRKAAPITPEKLVLQVAADEDGPSGRMKIWLLDTVTDECLELLEAPYHEQPFSLHRGSGEKYLFSVWLRKELDKSGDFGWDMFRLYDPYGKPLLPFETNGRGTCFDTSKRGWGITHRRLDEPLVLSSGWYHQCYHSCDVLIDQKGNCYGDFYYVAGQVPSYLGKTSTSFPKYIDKKVLCLSLPAGHYQRPCLTIVSEDGSRVDTDFECPWLFCNMSATLIKDKKIFGRTCLIVVDKEGYARLIDLEGREIENTTPIKVRTLLDKLMSQFIAQKR